MITSANNVGKQVAVTNVEFNKEMMHISLSDGRILTVPFHQITWLHWLAKATDAQRQKWEIEPGGFAVYWDDLDDGVEMAHLLAMESLA